MNSLSYVDMIGLSGVIFALVVAVGVHVAKRIIF